MKFVKSESQQSMLQMKKVILQIVSKIIKRSSGLGMSVSEDAMWI